jgi:hypothetical protein
MRANYIRLSLVAVLVVAMFGAVSGSSDELQLSAEATPVVKGKSCPGVALTVKNKSDHPLTNAGLEGVFRHENVQIEAPSSWEPRAAATTRSIGFISGRINSTLPPGGTAVYLVDLNDFFVKIPPGKSALTIRVKVWPNESGSGGPTELKTAVLVDVPAVPATTAPSTQKP